MYLTLSITLHQLLVQGSQKLGDGFTGDGLGGFLSKPDELECAADIGGRFENLASTIFGLITMVAGLAFLLYFALGAIRWTTSGGEPAKVEEAKSQMISAGIGLTAVAAAYTIAGIVSLVLGIDILNPTKMLQGITGGAGGC